MTPSEHLQAAKDKVARKKDYRDWKHVITGATQWEEKEFLEEAALLALTNQAEELTTKLKNQAEELADLKKSFNAQKYYIDANDALVMRQNMEIDQLKSELSRKEEMLKAATVARCKNCDNEIKNGRESFCSDECKKEFL